LGTIITGAYLFTRFTLQHKVKKHRALNLNATFSDPSVSQNPDTTLDLRPLFKTRLQQIIKAGSNGLYDITMDSIAIDILHSTISALNVKLISDPDILQTLQQKNKAPDDVFSGSIRKLRIEGINLDDFITRRTLDLKLLHLSGVNLRIDHLNSKKDNQAKDPLTLYKKLLTQVDKIAVKELLINNSSITIRNRAGKSKTSKLNDVSIRLQDLLIDSTTQHATDRFLFAKKAFITLNNFAMRTNDNLYQFKVKAISIVAPEHFMTLNGVSISSRYSKAQFQKQLKSRKEQYDVAAPSITFKNTDWWNLLNEEEFVAEQVSIKNPKVTVYLDRSLPPPASRMGNFPHQLLMKVPFGINIKEAIITGMSLDYTEYNPVSKQTGTVSFSNLRLEGKNITNIAGGNRMATFKSNGLFMKQVPFYAVFNFDLLQHKAGHFSSEISMKGFDGNIVNSIAKPLGLMAVDKGQVKEVKINIKGNQHSASGSIHLLYNDLKVSLFEKEADEDDLDKKGVIGKLANAFVIKNDNPPKRGSLRQPEVVFKRDPQAGFFNLVWKTSLAGILKSIGANEKLAAKKQ